MDQNSQESGTGYLIIGAHGQLGLALQARYPNARAVDSDALDITDSEAVNSFDWSDITHILNAAAYTNVDGAESADGRRAAWAVNAYGVANLSRVASANDSILVHISSDYVFDGHHSPHSEDEPLSPLSAYGASKAAGDIVAALAPKHYILRTSWVIGDGKNFVRTMMSLAEKDISPTVVHDQVGRPTFTNTLVDGISHLLSSNSHLPPSIPYGIYNVSNDGEPASWADITRAIFQELGRDDLTVTNTTTAEYYAGKEGIAPRPLQSALDLAKIQSTGFSLSDWRTDLKAYIAKQTN
jgi:dTDP-4-dehydrorhamnose 3,5-epimerase